MSEHSEIHLHEEPGADPNARAVVYRNPDNCSQCHNVGPGIVNGAVARLKIDLAMNGTKAPRMKDVEILLNALEGHHGNSQQ